MVSDLVEDMANDVYEALATFSNEWYKGNRDRRAFIRRHLADHDTAMYYIKEARKNLTLIMIDDKTPPTLKDQIHEALSRDAALRGEYQNLQPPPITKH